MPILAALSASLLALILSPAPPAAGDVEPLIAQLGSDDWSAREAADAALRECDPPGLAPLAPFLGRADLGPEQRSRLMDIAMERFALEPHAAMGIQWMGPGRQLEEFDAMPARISSTVPGFDAASKLRPGDLILAMDGHPLASRQEMRATIISHSPGDTTTLVVSRGALRVEVRLVLGSFAELQQTERPDHATLARALAIRLQRTTGSLPGIAARPLDGMSLAQWNRAASGPFQRGSAGVLDEEELGGLLVGGEARGLLPGQGAASEAVRPTLRFLPMAPGTGPGTGPRNGPTTGRPIPGAMPRPAIPPNAERPAPKSPEQKPPPPRPEPRPAPRPGA